MSSTHVTHFDVCLTLNLASENLYMLALPSTGNVPCPAAGLPPVFTVNFLQLVELNLSMLRNALPCTGGALLHTPRLADSCTMFPESSLSTHDVGLAVLSFSSV